MNFVGILLVGLMFGVVAAVVSLVSGGSVWSALLNYIAAGTVVSLLGAVVMIWRAYEAERPSADLDIGHATSASK